MDNLIFPILWLSGPLKTVKSSRYLLNFVNVQWWGTTHALRLCNWTGHTVSLTIRFNFFTKTSTTGIIELLTVTRTLCPQILSWIKLFVIKWDSQFAVILFCSADEWLQTELDSNQCPLKTRICLMEEVSKRQHLSLTTQARRKMLHDKTYCEVHYTWVWVLR